LNPVDLSTLEVILKKFLDDTNLLATNYEYYIELVMEGLEKKEKVTYLVKWRGFLAKQDLTYENYESLYSVGAKEEFRKFHYKNSESPRYLAFKIQKYVYCIRDSKCNIRVRCDGGGLHPINIYIVFSKQTMKYGIHEN
jgi:hypothetical protein